VSHDLPILKAYKDLNYLVTNINNEKNCALKIIYLDTYLNLTTPKCELVREFQKFSKKQNALVKFISKKFPDFKLSDSDDIDSLKE
jgi:hypothetical protein